jgi:hypothetical protein
MANEKSIQYHKIRRINVPGAQVTWAGESPWEGGFCFGNEEGGIQCLDARERFTPTWITSNDPINSIAFTSRIMAVSTPEQIFVQDRANFLFPKISQVLYDGGTHGIVTTRSDCLIAALGQSGLLLVGHQPDGGTFQRKIRPLGKDFYFYKVISLPVDELGQELFACAGREDGLAVLTVGPGGATGKIGVYEGQSAFNRSTLDVVDICSIGTPDQPFAIACLGIDNSLYLKANIMQPPSTTLRLPHLRGTGYSLLSTRGHLFVLTSECLYTLPHLATRFLSGPIPSKIPSSIDMPSDPIEAFMARDQFLLIVEIGSPIIIDTINDLPGIDVASDLINGSSNGPTQTALVEVAEPWGQPTNYELNSLALV